MIKSLLILIFTVILLIDSYTSMILKYQNQILNLINQYPSIPITIDSSINTSTTTTWEPGKGEYQFDSDLKLSKSSLLQRSNILIDKALEEDSTAQHSLGLLYHMGYGGVLQSDEYSTKWHAISALYGNIDAIAVLGGCLRKGSGIKQNKELGLELIYYAAEKLSPFGLVKKAHVIEQEEGEGKEKEILKLYELAASIPKSAIGLFNYGYMLYYTKNKKIRDREKAQQLFKVACDLAPNDGSDEAAHHLSLSLGGVDDVNGRNYMGIAAALGNQEAQKELVAYKKMIESFFDS